ncbi:ATP-binding cassette domain-containing protein [Oceanotoga teriensis]|uniref:ATP-binding cassette domain-containing protein n=1 Tax=Oceanotoga teriensis TaxID=515440 RepID=UPI002713E838|nr:ABC transporter ATP-binding protein [Oceanotoga teriensis]MDO7977224.1 ABC transporter ATP-binding protein [Oceanotoga teriensis]
MGESIKIDKVYKYYDDFAALKDVNLSFEKDKIYGLIGRNGAGKTTLLKIIANQLLTSKGDIFIGDKSLSKDSSVVENICLARETLGKAFETSNVFKMNVFFELCSKSFKNWDNDYAKYLIKKFRIDEKKYYSKLSKGMKTAVGIIMGLASRAEITLFDEPYVGLDPVAREVFYSELQKDYMEHPRTIIISSHLINELEGMFEKVIFIDNGSIIIDEDLESLREIYWLLQGRESKINKYTDFYKVLNVEKLGSLASYAIKGRLTEEEIFNMKSDDIEVSKISIQKLLYYLTNGGDDDAK